MAFTAPNWRAILVGATFTVDLGVFWHSRRLFGELWLRAIGKRRDNLGMPGPVYVATTVGSLVSACVLTVPVRAAGTTSSVSDMGIGVLVGMTIGGTATPAFTVSFAYELVAFAVEGGVFAVWR